MKIFQEFFFILGYNFEEFLNLNRSSKYTKGDVAWSVTLEFLKENENVLTTSFWTSRRRTYCLSRRNNSVSNDSISVLFSTRVAFITSQ